MKQSQRTNILLIDTQSYWREIAAQTLRDADFSVEVLDHYEYEYFHDDEREHPPDLIVLGCTNAGKEEQHFISHILAHKYHMLVLCTFLSSQVMRALFLKGVYDVTDKPYDPPYLLDVVEQVIQSIADREHHLVTGRREE